MKTSIDKLIGAFSLLAVLAAQTALGYYDPTLQRWLTLDPIGEAGGINIYQFVGNDPVNEVDPYGLQNFVARPGIRPSPRPFTWTRSFINRGELAREEIKEWIRWERDMTPVERLNYRASVDQYWMSRLGRPIRPGEAFISAAKSSSLTPLSNGTVCPSTSVVSQNAPPPVTISASITITTPYGSAAQANTPEAQAALRQVQSGAPVYRQGWTGTQRTFDAQNWALQNPATTPNFARQLGMPATATKGEYFWMMGGRVSPGAPVITRPAPGIGANVGGSMEAVANPGGVRIDWFHMPD